MSTLLPLLEWDPRTDNDDFKSGTHRINPVGVAFSPLLEQFRSEWKQEQENLRRSTMVERLTAIYGGDFLDQELQSLIPRHGIFSDELLEKTQLVRVTKIAADQGQSIEELGALYRDAHWPKLRQNRNTPPADEVFASFKFVVMTLVELAVYRLSFDSNAHQAIQLWYESVGRNQRCQICNEYFNPVEFNPIFYVRTDCETQCCFRCPIRASPNKEDCAQLVREFVDHCGFLPVTGFSLGFGPLVSRVALDRRLSVYAAYGAMGGINHVRMLFGNWFNALASSGSLPDGVLVTKRGIKCLAKDGHICLSMDEQRIDDWLYDHNFEHEKEPCYPKHDTLNPGSLRADWRVGDLYIEFFGMQGDSNYDIKTERKIALTTALNISLLAIYPGDMRHLDQVLATALL